ncbi:MAG TPA: hypothetical protein VFK92_06895 [Burkholderiales bacterium]|nr:hypothetical protein [Burkholderiales bacterium]
MRRAQRKAAIAWAMTGVIAGMAACTGNSTDSITVQGDVAIAYVKRPVSALGNPTDAVTTGQGGDLFIRDKSSPSGTETNITAALTNGQGDVTHPDVSFDGTKIVFAMRRPADSNWGIWEYDTATKTARRIACDAAFQGDDTEPSYLPDGRVVFISNRQETTKSQMQAAGRTPYTYVDEYDREQTAVLHVMNSDGSNCRQISFDQSHDRNPTVLSNGQILYSRWDHVGERNQFTIFTVNPDGTNLFVAYGAHSPGNSYMQPREMPDGHLIATLMPLSRTREGGSLEIIDHSNYSEIDEPGDNAPANVLGRKEGQYAVSEWLLGASPSQRDAMRDRGLSPLGRYRNPYPLWDGTNRVLAVFTPSQPTLSTDPLGNPVTVEGTPRYGIYMLDLGAKTLRPVVPPQDGFFFANPVALQPRPKPAVIGQFTPDPSIPAGFGLFDVHTVYDTDDKQRMGDAVLAAGESIPRVAGQPDVANLSTPGTSQYASRVARFFRITKAVPTPSGMDRTALGETEFEMQQIVGYGVVEPDGSIRTHVPADAAINITVLDANGRQFVEHTHWIQAREGERRFCKGCHSPRLTTTSLTPGTAATMAETRATGDAVRNVAPDPNYSNLKGDPSYTDFWTPVFNTQNGTSLTPQAPISITYSGLGASPVKGPASCATTWSAKDCAIVINFPDHIQPILTAKCASCHSGLAPAAGIDLSSTMSGEFARTMGYQSLLVGPPLLDANGEPIITVNEDGEFMIARETPPVIPGGARGSRLIERLFEQPLKADASATTRRAFCRAGGNSCFNSAAYVNHTTIANPLTAAEKRIITEWIDIGGTYFNDPYNGTTLRSAAPQLSETVFSCKVQPILQASCASCHQAFGGNGSSSAPANPNFAANRFVLTGNTPADFGVTATMVTNIAAPDSSLLLFRPSRSLSDTPPHPGGANATTPVLPSASASYATIRSWIAGTLTCQ